MTSPQAPTESTDAGGRPGPFAWVVIAVGWVIIVGSLLGVVRSPDLGRLSSWATFVIGGAIIHDAIILPIVIGAGWLIMRVLPAPWKVPVRTALIIGAVIGLAVWPIATRWGAREDNPSILPIDVWRNLMVLFAVLVLAAIAGGVWNTLRSSRASVEHEPRESHE